MPATTHEFFRLTVAGSTGELTDCSDTYLNANSTGVNYGSNANLEIDEGHTGGTATSPKRALVRFVIPNSATLGSARVATMKIHLYAHTANSDPTLSGDVTASDVTKTWLELGATWNTYTWAQSWTTAGGDVTQNWARVDDVFSTGWKTWDISDYAIKNSLASGDVVDMLISYQTENGGGTSSNNATFYSRNNTTALGVAWPSGAPGTWATGDPGKPVVEFYFIDAPPSAIPDFKAEPAADASRAKFKWTASTDPDCSGYVIRSDGTAGVDGDDGSILNAVGWGAAKITASGVTDAEMSASHTFNMNVVYYLRQFVEDAGNTGVNGTGGPELILIRPTRTAVNAEHGASADLPRTFKFSDFTVTPANYSVGDKIVMAAAGKGDNFTSNQLVVVPKAIEVDWNEGGGNRILLPPPNDPLIRRCRQRDLAPGLRSHIRHSRGGCCDHHERDQLRRVPGNSRFRVEPND